MFRKKKNMGSVTVFEEDDPSATGDDFDDLGLADSSAARADESQDLDGMSAQQLEALALGSAQAGKESTARALRLANETREIGVNTATAMHNQTVQLEKMSEDIEVVHDYLDKSERIIDKMSKPKLARMFQRKKAGGKGLDKVKTSRKDQEAREEIRQKGVDALDLDDMKPTEKGDVVFLDDLERNELLDGATPVSDVSPARRGRIGRRKKETPQAPVDARTVKEDYSQYSSGVAEVMRKQDDDLDQISGALADMQALGGAMNNELDYQDKLINEVQDFTVETSVRTKENAKKINKIK